MARPPPGKGETITYRLETDDVLGPLPDGFEKAKMKNGRVYFVDNKNKKTSWIDPRTFNLRKHDIRDTTKGELPYGWDEAYDPNMGLYYIDHNTKTTYMDAPWMPHVKERVLALESKAQSVKSKLEIGLEVQRQQEKQLNDAQVKIQQLELEKQYVERALDEVRGSKASLATASSGSHHSLKNDDVVAPNEEFQTPVVASPIARFDMPEQNLERHLSTLQEQIAAEKESAAAIELQNSKLRSSIQEFQAHMEGVASLREKITQAGNTDKSSANVKSNLDRVKVVLDRDATQREQLASYISQLKDEVLASTSAGPSSPQPQQQQQKKYEGASLPVPLGQATAVSNTALNLAADKAKLQDFIAQLKQEVLAATASSAKKPPVASADAQAAQKP